MNSERITRLLRDLESAFAALDEEITHETGTLEFKENEIHHAYWALYRAASEAGEAQSAEAFRTLAGEWTAPSAHYQTR